MASQDAPPKEVLSQVIEDKDLKKIREQYGGFEGLAKLLNTSLQAGLSKDEANNQFDQRISQYGANRIPEKEAKGFLELFYNALQSKIIVILIISAVISIFLGVFVEQDPHGWIEGTAIIIAVLVVATVTAGNDYSKEKQFRKLNAINDDKQVKVVRAAEQIVISTFNIQVGDIVILETGDKICADGLVTESDDLKVDESSMTGETDTVKKNRDIDPWMLSGCQVMEGRGKLMVVAVGTETQWGKIKALVNKESDPTPLQLNLENLAETIGKMGMVAAALTFLTLFIQWFNKVVALPRPLELADFGGLVENLITAITIVVVAVPEGLPLAVTISLAYSMFKMMSDNNLVRHLEACETMGGATNICSDKTGTLTENKMTVVKSWIGTKAYEEPPKDFLEKEMERLLVEGISANSTAYIVKKDANEKNDYVGSKTECALLEFAEKLGYDYTEIRKNIKVEKMWPFSSAKKRMSALMARGNNGRHLVYTKGASEMILEICNKILDDNGKPVPLTMDVMNVAKAQIHALANTGLRTIGLAYTEIPPQPDWTNPPEREMTLIGICGIKDPVRKEVPQAVADCQKAGITVRMLTGDNVITAKYIAQECGILTPDGLAVEGPDFRKWTDEEMDEKIPKLQVMARSSPQDKYRLVSRLRQLGEVVAVTGDGTNDAPQLKEADVGFSMGITGTEVAKEASDIILLDDNFKSIVKAVMWGRNVYDSIRKFVQFQVTVNVVAVIVAFVGAVSNGESPLKPVQMLWVNLIMDTMAALALATEPPSPELLQRKPYGRFESIITPSMWRNIIGQAVFQIIVLFVLMYSAQTIPYFELPANLSAWTDRHHTVHTTIIFNTFVLCQLFNEINCRKLGNELNILSGIFSNGIFWSVMLFCWGTQYLIVQFGGEFTQTAGLSEQQWMACIAIGSFSIPLGLALRVVFPLNPQAKEVVEGEAAGKLTLEAVAMELIRANRENEKLGLRSTVRKEPAVKGDLINRGNQAIQWAAAYGKIDVVMDLLNDERVNPAADDNLALRWASSNGHLAVVQELLKDRRVDPTALDNRAAKLAAKYGHVDIVRELLNYENEVR